MIVYFEELSARKRAGGIETACQELVTQLDERGVTAIRSSSTPRHLASRPDVVHIHGLWSPRLAIQFWRWQQRRIPCVISTHGMLSAWALSYKSMRKRVASALYQQPILNRADCIHATSEDEIDQVARRGVTTRSIAIPWGIKPHGSTAIVVDKNSDFRTAVFAGRLCPVKGIDILIEAWHNVQPLGWKLKIIGPDEAGYRSRLEQLVTANGLSRCISFEGEYPQEKLQKALQRAEILVLPSHSENFGMVVGEALSLGVPVITTRGTPWKRIADTKCGWWVPATQEALGQAIAEATSLPSYQLRQMGAIGSDLVRNEYSWENIAKRFIELYKLLALSRRKHDGND
jgi:glycosyltransferase involved in cell wall biosynthesis